MKELFSMQGRFNRQKYILTGIVISLVMYVLAFGVGFAIGISGADPQVATSASYLIWIAGVVIWAFLVVKRLHDLGKPGWHYWLMFVPLYNLYLSVILLFQKGIEGSNEYGEDPCKA